MASTFTLPAVGAVDKRAVLGIGVVAAGVVGFAYWRKRNAPAEPDPTASDFGEGENLPGVLNSVPANNAFGEGSAPEPLSPDAYGFRGTTNSEWTQYAAEKLSQSDAWPYAAVLAALGQYLAGAPLTSAQRVIVQAALAVAGNPPVGGPRPVISGGDTPLTVAPQITSAKARDTTSAVITCTAVAGAAGYRVYRHGAGSNVGSATGTTIIVSGLTPGHTYSFTVRAITASGKESPPSAAKTVKLALEQLHAPGRPRISSIAATHAHASVAPVKGARAYNWYLHGAPAGNTSSPAFTFTHLKPHTRYSVSVRADSDTAAKTKPSPGAAFTTKR